MNLFKTLSEVLGEGCTATITVAKKDGQMTVSILPGNALVKDAAKNNIAPLNVTGTAEELDEGLAQAIAAPIQKASGLLADIAAYEKSVEEARAKTKMEEERKAAEKKQRDDFAAWVALARQNLKEEKYKDALKCCNEAEKVSPDDKSKLDINKLRVEINDASGVGTMFGANPDKSDGKNVKLTNKTAAKPAKAECADDNDNEEE